MTLKADDVQRKRMESNAVGDSTDSGFKKSISGFAQPGPQSPNNEDNENCNKSNKLNEDDSSKSLLIHLLFYLTRLITSLIITIFLIKFCFFRLWYYKKKRIKPSR